MKTRSIITTITSAGFTIKLCFKYPQTAAEVIVPFHHAPRSTPPDAVITIHNHAIAMPPKVQTSGTIISGEGEYEGYFDFRRKKGNVVLSGRNNEYILANFLTQVFSILVSARRGLMIHGACVIRNGQAYIFHGVSGAGKSTACRFSSGCDIASDDITAVRKIGRQYLAWGLPQLGRFPVPEKQGPYPIAGFFRLVKDTKVSIGRVSGATAAAGMLALWRNQLTIENIRNMLVLLANLTNHVPCYELHFRKDATFWNCIDRIKGAG